MQASRSVSNVIEKKFNLQFSVRKFPLNILLSEYIIIIIIIIRIFYNFRYFPFPALTLYTILCPSENFPCNIFTVYCNKTNQQSLSLTTLTPSAVLPTLIQLYYL